MKYLQSGPMHFSGGGSQAYRDGWDRTFGDLAARLATHDKACWGEPDCIARGVSHTDKAADPPLELGE